ncbi:MAG: gliding motility-associated C-terminal domain-containing protein [Bacteroidia bacterium]|nr:gliding motility-associated C-terminal domain-containing protein [Bacteroidia bacterium]
MKQNRLFPILFLLIGLTLFSCKKQKIESRSCEGTMTILTSGYNQDSVKIFIPNVFTPNFDTDNDIFGVFGTGIVSKKLTVYSGASKIYTNDEDAFWDGQVNGKVKTGIFRYEIELVTIHGETVNIEGKFTSLGENPNEFTLENCADCIFGDMIDSELGAIFTTNESLSGCP